MEICKNLSKNLPPPPPRKDSKNDTSLNNAKSKSVNSKNRKNIAIILAGGVGERLGFEFPKQFVKFAGKTCLEHVLDIFSKHPKIHHIIIVCHENYINLVRDLAQHYNNISIIKGGTNRNFSTLNALTFIQQNFTQICTKNSQKFSQKNSKPKISVLIHDAARPLLDSSIIDNCLAALNCYKAIDTAIKASDTIIKARQNVIKSIPNRNELFYGQTPQCFDFEALFKAYEKALENDKTLSGFSDDCGVFLRYCRQEIFVVRGSLQNHKLTHTEDIAFIDRLFAIKNANLQGKFDFKGLTNKVLVVFGGNSGIGKQICKIARVFGAKPYAFSTQNGYDVRKNRDILRALNLVVKNEGKIDAVINMAGILQKAPLLDMCSNAITQGISVNFTANINIARASFSHLKSSGGMLIFTSSSSYSRGREGYALYSSCKSALVNLAQALADEWSKYGVKVNAIAPSRTKTPMREANFGKENAQSLLSAEFVAQKCLQLYLSNTTGEILLVNKTMQNATFAGGGGNLSVILCLFFFAFTLKTPLHKNLVVWHESPKYRRYFSWWSWQTHGAGQATKAVFRDKSHTHYHPHAARNPRFKAIC